MAKKILLTGATGMLGNMLYKHLITRTDDAYHIFTLSTSAYPLSSNHTILDLTDADALSSFLEQNSFDIAIQCAAFVNLNFCKSEPEKTHALHAFSTELICKSIPEVYYISTDSVFDGIEGNYIESDETAPVNAYAESKLEGEKKTLMYAKKPYVLRCNIFGFHEPAMKGSLFEWAYSELKNGKPVNGFSNVHFNPLYTGSLATMIGNFIENENAAGIYHFGSAGKLSKYDFLLKVAQYFDFDASLITPLELEPFALGVRRPLNTTLNVDKLSKSGIHIPTIDDCFQSLYLDFKNSKHGQ